MEFKERLAELMRAANLTQKSLANKTNGEVSVATINAYLSGESEPNITRLTALADALGTTSAYLMGETDNPLKIERLSFHAPNVGENSTAIFETIERELTLIVEERELLKKKRALLEGKNNGT